jgi:hypothetical protein
MDRRMSGLYSKNNINITITPNVSTDSILSVIPCSIIPFMLVDTNPNRKGLIIYNQSIYSLFIKFGDGNDVSTTNFTIIIVAGSTYEMTNSFAGKISAVWEQQDDNGIVRITELI